MPSTSFGSSHSGRRHGGRADSAIVADHPSARRPVPSQGARRAFARAAEAIALLDAVTDALDGGEHRAGQRDMVHAVADAISAKRHLVVAAGTGTGKSLAYLIPTVLSGKRTVVATATKALQDQLAGKDLPLLAAQLDRPLEFAVLKGRSNYVCRQRLRELDKARADDQLSLDGVADRAAPAELASLARWASDSPTGDRAELDVEPSAAAWSAVSVSAQECPGATRCPSGGQCFAEMARARAAEADVVVVNQHLFGLHVASGGMLLPEHDVVVIDEAHQLEDVVSATAGIDLAATRFTAVRRAVHAVLDDPEALAALDSVVADWDRALVPDVGRRLAAGSIPKPQTSSHSRSAESTSCSPASARSTPPATRTSPPGASGRSSWHPRCSRTSTRSPTRRPRRSCGSKARAPVPRSGWLRSTWRPC